MMATHRQIAARRLQALAGVSYQQATHIIDEALRSSYPPTSSVHDIGSTPKIVAGDLEIYEEDRHWVAVLDEIAACRDQILTLRQLSDPSLEQLLRMDSISREVRRMCGDLVGGDWGEPFGDRVFDKVVQELVAGRFDGWPDDMLYGEASTRISEFADQPESRECIISGEDCWWALVRAGYATDTGGWELNDTGLALFFPDGPNGKARPDYLAYAFPNEYELVDGEAVRLVGVDD